MMRKPTEFSDLLQAAAQRKLQVAADDILKNKTRGEKSAAAKRQKKPIEALVLNTPQDLERHCRDITDKTSGRDLSQPRNRTPVLRVLNQITESVAQIPKPLLTSSLSLLLNLGKRDEIVKEGQPYYIGRALLAAIRAVVDHDKTLIARLPTAVSQMVSFASNNDLGKVGALKAIAEDIRHEWNLIVETRPRPLNADTTPAASTKTEAGSASTGLVSRVYDFSNRPAKIKKKPGPKPKGILPG